MSPERTSELGGIVYHFVGRGGDRYYWEAPMRGDSRCVQISCPVAWYWAHSGRSGVSDES